MPKEGKDGGDKAPDIKLPSAAEILGLGGGSASTDDAPTQDEVDDDATTSEPDVPVITDADDGGEDDDADVDVPLLDDITGEPPDPNTLGVAGDDADDDDEGETRYQPDPIIREALKNNPDALKRVEEQFKGLAKKDRQLSQRAQEVQQLAVYGQRLLNPESYESTLSQIISEVAATHRVTPEDVLSRLTGKSASQQGTGDSGQGTGADTPTTGSDATVPTFEYEGDKKVYEAAVKAAEDRTRTMVEASNRQLLESLGVNPAEMKAVLDNFKSQQAAQKDANWVDAHAPRIIAKAEKTLGWKISDKQVLEARKMFPQEKDMILALKRAFPDEYATARSKPAKKGPEMVQGTTPRASSMPTKPINEWTAADILAANRG